MSTEVVKRVPTWRTLVWVGVVGSILAWAWVWFLDRGPSVIMLLFALTAFALSFRATAGNRLALAATMICGLAMLMSSLYWMVMLYTADGSVGVADVFTASIVPFVAAMILLAGSAVGFRHARAA